MNQTQTLTETQSRTIDKAVGSELKRFVSLEVQSKRELKVDEENRTVELAFSSEQPYERWFGDEILDHTDGAIDFSRLRSGGAVLMDHNWTDQIGVVESVRIDSDKVARAVVRFSRSARGQEIFNDVIDGIRTNISVGYFINEMILEKQGEEKDTYRVTKWEPFEISLVSVPADPTVGVGRSMDKNPGMDKRTDETPENPTEEPVSTDGQRADQEIEDISEAATLETEEDTSLEDEISSQSSSDERSSSNPLINDTEVQNMDKTQIAEAVQAEQARVAELLDVGEKFGAQDLAREFAKDGEKTVADLHAAILEKRGFDVRPAEGTTEIGLTEKEKRGYSFSKLINALANPNDKRAQEAAKFELEVGAEASRKANKEARGVMVPFEVLSATRAHTAGTPEAGGNLIATDLLSGSFIDILQNRLAIMGAGATMLTGLEGNIAIPRQTGGAAAFWLDENGEPSESSATFDQIALTPKTVGAFTELSRKLIQQSSINAEQFVQNELIRIMALEIDRAALNGSGQNNQPRGLLNTTGIGSVEMGANGGALNFGSVVDLETAISDANADVGSLRYLTNAKVRGAAKQTERFSGTGQTIWSDGGMNGYPATISNQVPKNGTKGTGTDLSTMIFGNFSDLLIGMWGGLDLQVNPYSLDKKGAVRVTAFQDIDTVVRHPESFAAIRDIKA